MPAPLTPAQWAYLGTLPRTTLQNRVDYYAAKDAMEEENAKAKRIRPYIFHRLKLRRK